jgi:hypothetical protein
MIVDKFSRSIGRLPSYGEVMPILFDSVEDQIDTDFANLFASQNGFNVSPGSAHQDRAMDLETRAG